MQTEPNAKQQIVEKIKNSTNILVTVSRNPSVDALSAALSLTLMLNRLDKHATAVFSGQIPQAINFLEPSKTFENSVDSLRDFIIALDKEKADRLRYKVEDDVVRIFITPYKTVITEKDLRFSQGDFNVELIIALGVEKREDLDAAITAHGRILHDASVVSINSSGGQSTLESTDWTDASASSLCEMLMSLSEALQPGLLDQQIATAVLTGIVSATDRFRNEHTSPRVMTMAAQLMAAGANQQLIAAKLEEGHALPIPVNTDSGSSTSPLNSSESQKIATESPKSAHDGELEILHTSEPDAAPMPDKPSEALKEAETELAKSLEASHVPSPPTLSVEDIKNDLAQAEAELGVESGSDAAVEVSEEPQNSTDTEAQKLLDGKNTQTQAPKIIKQPRRTWRADPAVQPAFGGTLNATAGDAEEAKREEALSYTNHQILQHDAAAPSDKPSTTDHSKIEDSPVLKPAFEQVSEFESSPGLDDTVTQKPLESTSDDVLSFEPTPLEKPAVTLEDIDNNTRGKEAEEARAAIDAALSSLPFDPAGKPIEAAGAVPVFEVTHENAQPGPPAVPPMTPDLPPLPDFSTLPPLPGEQLPIAPPAPYPSPSAPLESTQIPNTPVVDIQPSDPQQEPHDPAQFKIPGQQ